ncbi:MAG: helix-turn-helix domain-containing protein [Deltaproteobacteria bacterium]|nr:helix-turn-helix domain-containing protein [Deltaproteobacteria bacterium]
MSNILHPIKKNTRNLSVSEGARLIFVDLTLMAGNRGYCWCGIEYMAREFGVSRRTIKSRLKEMVKAKLISLEDGYIHIIGLTPKPDAKTATSWKNSVSQVEKKCQLADQNQPIPKPEHPVTATTLATPVESNPSTKRQVVKDLKEKKQTNTAHPESKPTPPTSEQRPSVSLEPMIKNFEDIVKWADNTCMACGSKTKLVESLIDGRGKKTDLTNVQACCEKCTGDASNTFQEGMRTDYRARFAQSH